MVRFLLKATKVAGMSASEIEETQAKPSHITGFCDEVKHSISQIRLQSNAAQSELDVLQQEIAALKSDDERLGPRIAKVADLTESLEDFEAQLAQAELVLRNSEEEKKKLQQIFDVLSAAP